MEATPIGDTLNTFVRDPLFPNFPGWADLTDVFTNPDAYDDAWPVVCWDLGAIVISIVGPIMEEFYFRGYLLPHIVGPPVVVVAGGVVLFAVYHIFSIWMVPVRIIELIASQVSLVVISRKGI